MNVYIYKTKCGETGYFQVNEPDDAGLYKCQYLPANNNSMDYVGALDVGPTFLEKNNINNPLELNEPDILFLISEVINFNGVRGTFEVDSVIKASHPGSYFARMNRGEPQLFNRHYLEKEMSDEVRAYENIANELVSIFQTIEPEEANLAVYGNKIRELLIISCTEVEYLLKQILTTNDVKPKRRNYTTEDYIWCLNTFKLNWYQVSLANYLEFSAFKPFKEWSSGSPTTSLFWYDAYNKVKHDRGNTKSKGSLNALINSIAAIHILLEAQYGKEIFEFRYQYTYRTIFRTNFRPRWGFNEISAPILSFHGPSWIEAKAINSSAS